MDVTILEEALSQVDRDIAISYQNSQNNQTQDIPPTKIRRITRQGTILTDTTGPSRRTRRARKVPRYPSPELLQSSPPRSSPRQSPPPRSPPPRPPRSRSPPPPPPRSRSRSPPPPPTPPPSYGQTVSFFNVMIANNNTSKYSDLKVYCQYFQFEKGVKSDE